MKEEKIQTLHPITGKTNKAISLAKYNFIKQNLLEIIANKQLSHTSLMEALYERVKDHFEGGVQWYGEVVKLDLEANGLIKRTKDKPEQYIIVQ